MLIKDKHVLTCSIMTSGYRLECFPFLLQTKCLEISRLFYHFFKGRKWRVLAPKVIAWVFIGIQAFLKCYFQYFDCVQLNAVCFVFCEVIDIWKFLKERKVRKANLVSGRALFYSNFPTRKFVLNLFSCSSDLSISVQTLI